jgi:hypothetical protein
MDQSHEMSVEEEVRMKRKVRGARIEDEFCESDGQKV